MATMGYVDPSRPRSVTRRIAPRPTSVTARPLPVSSIPGPFNTGGQFTAGNSIAPNLTPFNLASENTSSAYPATAYTPGPNPTGMPTGSNPSTANVTDPFNGFASAFRPEAAPTIFQEPQIALQQVMRNMGMNPTTQQGLYQMGVPFADYANPLAMLSLGQGKDLGAGSQEAALNFMGNYFQGLMTPGGRGVDFNEGLKALQGVGKGSVLDQFLNIDDPRQQIANFKSLALPLAAAGLHPFFARAFENAVNQQGDAYLLNQATKAKPYGNFGQSFAAQSPLF